MSESVDRKLHRAVGLSDLAALLAAGFSFPNEQIAQALSDGRFLADWRASMIDACGIESEGDVGLANHCVEAFAGVEQGPLRREYSRLFLAPGVDVLIWPYESPFVHRMMGAEGDPSFLRTRIAIDVERRMTESGVTTVDLRREPVDSIFHELEFLAHLHACVAEAVRVEDVAAEAEWRNRLDSFARDHFLKWCPRFMSEVRSLSQLAAYRALSDMGMRYMCELAAEVGLEASLALEGAGDETVSPRIS